MRKFYEQGELALKQKHFLIINNSFRTLSMARDNITSTTIRLIQYLDIHVTPHTIEQELAEHESPSSLAALSDALHKWGIKNYAYRVEIESFEQLPRPFLVHLTDHQGQFGFVTEVNKSELTLIKENQNPQRISLLAFKQQYNGITVVLEPQDNAGEPKYYLKQAEQWLHGLRVPLLGVGLTIALAGLISCTNNVPFWLQLPMLLLVILKAGGIGVSVLLLNQSFGTSSTLVERLCDNSGTNCASVLASPGSKLAWGLISWAELGFFYFTGTVLILLLLPRNEEVITIVSALNILCLLFSFYSIYYQYRIARQWCILCCTLLIIFYCEFLVLFVSYHFISALVLVSWIEILKASGIMIAPIVGWMFFKPYFVSNASAQKIRQQLNRFERDKGMFDLLLHQQSPYPVPDNQISITWGKSHAKNVFTIVSRPSCRPCARAHQAIERLMQLRDDIQVRLILLVDKEHDQVSTLVASTLLGMQLAGLTDEVKYAQSAWYEKMDYPAWSRIYPLHANPRIEELLDEHQRWCEILKVEATPTLIINGYQLPDAYTVEMLRYLL